VDDIIFKVMGSVSHKQRCCLCFVEYAMWWHQSDVNQYYVWWNFPGVDTGGEVAM